MVCTEYCSIHPSSDDFPYAYLSLWDEDDVRVMARMADAVHAHGSLLGVELWHGGFHSNNKLTREPVLSPSGQRTLIPGPSAARAMDRSDIRAFLGWQREAAERARRAGADIVYVYAGHDYLPFQFLSPRTNRRTDEYGGSLANRCRLIHEMIEETREAVKGQCAVAVRLAVDELHGPSGITSDGEAQDIVAHLAELPDLWDVNVAGALGNDSRSARFSGEGFQEQHVSFVKQLTTKPVVGVGRFTSPDAMVRQIREGILDFIGAARPSIADPFLPQKISEGREDEIRECIGCNICRSANNEAIPLRCTQNPTIGEEWRRGWHPETIPPAHADQSVLVVGAGPAGLEAALQLGKRGYRVMLAEASRELGGRILSDSRLPGLGTWIRVRDHRVHMLSKLDNVEIFRESRLEADHILDLAPDHVVIATGSRWRRDGIGAAGIMPVPVSPQARVFTPDNLDGIDGAVLIYDDDHYYMGGALAEQLRRQGHEVHYVTTQPIVSAWTVYTDEQYMIEPRLVDLGVMIHVSHSLVAVEEGRAVFHSPLRPGQVSLPFGSLILVTGREPVDGLHGALEGHPAFTSVTRIGDCLVPSSIADAVHGGHRFARELGLPQPLPPVRRERPEA